MRALRTLRVTGGAVATGALLLTLTPAAGAVTDRGTERRPGALVPVYAGPPGAPSVVEDRPATRAAARVRITVTYSGFTAPAKAAFQRAVNTWAATLTSPVPITVQASWEPLGTGILGSAGPSYLWKIGNVWYADALANKKSGHQLNPAPDIVARFSSAFSNWHFGSGPAPAGTYDFQSVVTHELGHGVGFLGLGRVTGKPRDREVPGAAVDLRQIHRTRQRRGPDQPAGQLRPTGHGPAQ